MKRSAIFEMVDAGGDDKPSVIYDTTMLVTIVVSLVPLCFKTSTPLLSVLDKVTVSVFIVDYILRWFTADFLYPRLGWRVFAIYPFTPWALIDLAAILPSFNILNAGFRVLKVFRLLRTFRVLKFLRYSKSLTIVLEVLKKEKRSLLAVCYLALGYIFTTALILFNVEPDTFSNFPEALYWAGTALTTVGYGDIYPVTSIGRFFSVVSALAGIAIVALPSGIITAGYMEELKASQQQKVKASQEAQATNPMEDKTDSPASVINLADRMHK